MTSQSTSSRSSMFLSLGIFCLTFPSASLAFVPTETSTFKARSFDTARYVTPSFAYAPVPNEESSTEKKTAFDRRMRDLVFGKKKQKEPKTRVRKGDGNRPENIVTVESLQDYKTVVADEKDRIVVVRFFATWCKACKAIAPGFYRLARNNPNVVFVEVPVTDHNAALHQGLGIPSIPYGHIYHPEAGLTEEVKISRKYFPRFESMVRWYVEESCDVIDGEAASPFAALEKASAEK